MNTPYKNLEEHNKILHQQNELKQIQKSNPTLFDIAVIRKDFPILNQTVNGNRLIYFDNAATSQKPIQVIEAIRNYYLNDNANVHRGIRTLSNRATVAFEKARERVASFINAKSSDEIIFTRGTTESINLVANSWGLKNLKPGDKILLTEMEHHSNIVPWQIVAERTGAEIVYVPITGDDDYLDLEAFERLLTPQVKIFSIVHISNSLGTINPVKELCHKAKTLGIVTLVDAAQSAGHCPIDVSEIDCDFLTFSGHKICGPTGIGVLYGKYKILETMPPYQSGGEMILNVDYYKTAFKKPPHRFEAGTPDISGPIGLHTAMDYLDSIGRDLIFEHDKILAQYAYDRLKEISGIRIFGPPMNRGGLVSFALKDIHAHDVVTVADQFGVALRGGHHCTQPLMKKLGVESTARASFYFYNTTEEADRFINVIKEIQKFFTS